MFVARNSDQVQIELGRDNVKAILCYQLLVCTLLIFYPFHGALTFAIVPVSLVLKYMIAWRSPINRPMLFTDLVLALLVGVVYGTSTSNFHYTPIISAAAFIWARLKCDFMLPSKSRFKDTVARAAAVYEVEQNYGMKLDSTAAEAAGMAIAPYIIAVFNCIIVVGWAIIAVL